MKLQIKYLKMGDIKPYKANSRTHSDTQVEQIAASISEFGFTNPILIHKGTIVAGHGRIEASKLLELSEIPTIELSGLTKKQVKALVIADNQLALNAGWDIDLLRTELEELRLAEFDIDLLGFEDDMLSMLSEGSEDGEDDEPYSRTIETPDYIPQDKKPSLSDLTDTTKTNALIQEINNSALSDDEKAFLRLAAERHTVFDFKKIADYFAHSEIDTQHLMERSALVIIDLDKAIANGFVKMTKSITEQYGKDYQDDE